MAPAATSTPIATPIAARRTVPPTIRRNTVLAARTKSHAYRDLLQSLFERVADQPVQPARGEQQRDRRRRRRAQSAQSALGAAQTTSPPASSGCSATRRSCQSHARGRLSARDTGDCVDAARMWSVCARPNPSSARRNRNGPTSPPNDPYFASFATPTISRSVPRVAGLAHDAYALANRILAWPEAPCHVSLTIATGARPAVPAGEVAAANQRLTDGGEVVVRHAIDRRQRAAPRQTAALNADSRP